MKQTAVDWLDRWFRDNLEATHEEGNKALKQAKQMEKEQMNDSYKEGYFVTFPSDVDFNNYYQETYGEDENI